MGKRKLKTVFWVFLLLIVTGLIGCKQKEPEKEQLCHIVMEKGGWVSGNGFCQNNKIRKRCELYSHAG